MIDLDLTSVILCLLIMPLILWSYVLSYRVTTYFKERFKNRTWMASLCGMPIFMISLLLILIIAVLAKHFIVSSMLIA